MRTNRLLSMLARAISIISIVGIVALTQSITAARGAGNTNVSPASSNQISNCNDACPASNSGNSNLSTKAAAIPVLSVTPTSLTITGVNGPSAVYTQTATLSATGGNITYNTSIAYTGTSGWLSVIPSNGVVTTRLNVPVTLTASNTGLAAGTYQATVFFNDVNNPADTASIKVTFVVNPAPTTATTAPTTTVAPTTTPVPTTTAATTTVATTTTPVPTTTTTTVAPTTTATTTTVQSSGIVTITGKVLVNGTGTAGISVRLAGGLYTQTDSQGNYSFNNQAPGSYQPVVLVDTSVYKSVDNFAKATDVNGYVHSSISVEAYQTANNVNFNLSTANATTQPTTTTSVATTTAPTTATPEPVTTTGTTIPATSTTTQPAQTGIDAPGATDFAGCQPLSPLPDVLSFNYCTTQSDKDPNIFRVDILVYNSTNTNIDLSHTLIFNLGEGTQTRKPSASTGNVTISSDNTQLSWGSFQLAPGQSATLSFYISKAASTINLVNSINATGINQAISSPFSAVLPAIAAKAGRGQSPIYPIGGKGGPSPVTTVSSNATVSNPPNLPYTGIGQTQVTPETNVIAVLAIITGIILSLICSLGLALKYQKRRK